MSEDDRDLPLHDEAMARSKWRGGETILKRDRTDDSGPASEVDNAGAGGGSGSGSSGGLAEKAAQRPPD
jgi:hypothetical protein